MYSIKRLLEIRKSFIRSYIEIYIQLNQDFLKLKYKYQLVVKLKIIQILYKITLLFIFLYQPKTFEFKLLFFLSRLLISIFF